MIKDTETPPSEKLIRDCIFCGHDDCDDIFTFTHDFLVKVRGQNPEAISQKGWVDGKTSTIVKCRRCGTNYVRDILLPPDDFKSKKNDYSESSKAFVERKKSVAVQQTFKHYRAIDENNWLTRSLILLAADHFKRDVRFLDFGAGGGDISNAARLCGVREVVAYDPFYADNIQAHFDTVNFPGIHCINAKEDLTKMTPFDVVVFQSAIEHVSDPIGELRTIHSMMSKGGYLYINNPVMNIDRELESLKKAPKIVKSDRISYYHPSHVNYLMPKTFARMLKDTGFEITPILFYPPLPFTWNFLGRHWKQKMKFVIRTIQCALGLPFDRHVYVLRKP